MKTEIYHVPRYKKRNIITDIAILSAAFVGVIFLTIGIMIIALIDKR